MDAVDDHNTVWAQDMAQFIDQVKQTFLSDRENGVTQPLAKIADAHSVEQIRSYATFDGPLPVQQVFEEAADIFSYRVHMDHKRWFGFIPAPILPASVAGELLTSIYNPHAGSWFQSSGPSAIENELLNWLARQIGLPDGAGGSFCSGGSMANLTGLMVARDQKLGEGEIQNATIYVSDQTHLSIAKGLRILGFKQSQLRKISTDEKFQTDLSELRSMISKDRKAGLVPIAVVASCGTTNTGSIDPLNEIANIAKFEGLWMHVDGAYGASIVLSKKHCHLADGLARADSISWDAHKWLFQTYGCGIILVRDKRHLLESCSVDAEYVRDAAHSLEEPNFWNFSIELTRPARAMKLWFTLRTMGTKAVVEMIDHGVRQAEVAENELRKCADWRILSPAQMGIVVFRFEPQDLDESELDELNVTISKAMLAHNLGGVLTTKLRSRIALRICSLSSELKEQGMRNVVGDMVVVARNALGSQQRT